jgi:hypothetical protein
MLLKSKMKRTNTQTLSTRPNKKSKNIEKIDLCPDLIVCVLDFFDSQNFSNTPKSRFGRVYGQTHFLFRHVNVRDVSHLPQSPFVCVKVGFREFLDMEPMTNKKIKIHVIVFESKMRHAVVEKLNKWSLHNPVTLSIQYNCNWDDVIQKIQFDGLNVLLDPTQYASDIVIEKSREITFCGFQIRKSTDHCNNLLDHKPYCNIRLKKQSLRDESISRTSEYLCFFGNKKPDKIVPVYTAIQQQFAKVISRCLCGSKIEGLVYCSLDNHIILPTTVFRLALKNPKTRLLEFPKNVQVYWFNTKTASVALVPDKYFEFSDQWKRLELKNHASRTNLADFFGF